jgi:hypothetical protein
LQAEQSVRTVARSSLSSEGTGPCPTTEIGPYRDAIHAYLTAALDEGISPTEADRATLSSALVDPLERLRAQTHASDARHFAIVGVERPAERPSWLVIAANLETPTMIMDGTDEQTALYLFEPREGHWRLRFADETDDACGRRTNVTPSMVHATSAEGPYLVSTYVGEVATWFPLRLRVLDLGADAISPRVLLDDLLGATPSPEDRPTPVVEETRNGFVVHFEREERRGGFGRWNYRICSVSRSYAFVDRTVRAVGALRVERCSRW